MKSIAITSTFLPSSFLNIRSRLGSLVHQAVEPFSEQLTSPSAPRGCFSPSDADIKVLCSPNVLGIRAKEDFFKYHNVSLELLHLPNNTCRAVKTTVNNVTYYASRISKEKYLACGGRPLEVAQSRNHRLLHKASVDLRPFVSTSAEKLHPHHLLAQPAVPASGPREHHQEPAHQAGLQVCLPIHQEGQPAL